MKRETSEQGDVRIDVSYVKLANGIGLRIDGDKSDPPLVFFRVSTSFHTSGDSPTHQ